MLTDRNSLEVAAIKNKISMADPSPAGKYADVVMLSPVHREMKPHTQEAIGQITMATGIRTGFARGISMVSCARNILASSFLAGPWKRAIWIDDDMIATPADVVNLLDAQEREGYDVLGSIYMERTGKSFCHTPFGAKGEVISSTFDGHVEPCAGVGFGLTVTTRRAFERCKEQTLYPLVNYPEMGDGYFSHIDYLEADDGDGDKITMLGEDFSFCWRVRAGGGKVGVHTGIWPLHIGECAMGFWHWHAQNNQPRPDPSTNPPEMRTTCTATRRHGAYTD